MTLPEPLQPERSGWPWTVDSSMEAMGAEANASAESDLPTITIITPSYNQGAFLEETIRSVLAQGYPHLEYIVLDGGSSDSSRAILEHYHSHITYWESRPDAGQADAINRGFAMAKGNILGWINSDDTYLPGTLLAVGRFFVRHETAKLLYGEGWYIDDRSQRIEPCRFVRRRFDRNYIVNKDPILQPAAFWRRDLWDAVGPLNVSLHWVFDWEWFVRAHELAQFDYLPQFLANYRVQPQAKTRTGGIERQREHGRVTRHYGRWWHPNHLVQQTRRLDASIEQVTRRWPAHLAWPLRFLGSLPRTVLERVLHGTYMR